MSSAANGTDSIIGTFSFVSFAARESKGSSRILPLTHTYLTEDLFKLHGRHHSAKWWRDFARNNTLHIRVLHAQARAKSIAIVQET